jgi:hypothetical protein
LAYSYASGTLFIGPDAKHGGSNVIKIAGDLNLLISDEVREGEVETVPNEDAVWQFVTNYKHLNVTETDGLPTLSNINTLEFDSNSGLQVLSGATPDAAKIVMGAHWKIIQVNGQPSLMASGTSNGPQTIELVDGENITISTDANLNQIGFHVPAQYVDLDDTNYDDAIASVKAIREHVDQKVNIINLNHALQKFEFPDPALQFLVEHNKNTEDFITEIRGPNNRPVWADIEIIDSNSFYVNYTEAEECTVLLKF